MSNRLTRLEPNSVSHFSECLQGAHLTVLSREGRDMLTVNPVDFSKSTVFTKVIQIAIVLLENSGNALFYRSVLF